MFNCSNACFVEPSQKVIFSSSLYQLSTNLTITAPNGNWFYGWDSLGGEWNKYTEPVVGRNQDGRLEVFMVGNDTQI